MKELLSPVFEFLLQMGGTGIFILAVLDGSFLFLPFGVDILLIGISARNEDLSLLYAVLATGGTLAGSSLLWYLARKGGEAGLARFGREDRVKYVTGRLQKHAGWALVFASLMPPPFPYRLFVAAAAVAEFPLSKLLLYAGIARFIRYSVEVYLSHRYGSHIINYVSSSEPFQYLMASIVVLSIAGSIYTVVSLARRQPASH